MRLRIMVVLPDPKKPVIRVMGIGPIASGTECIAMWLEGLAKKSRPRLLGGTQH